MKEIGELKIIKSTYTVYITDDYKELNEKEQEIDNSAIIRPEKVKEKESPYGLDGFICYASKIICIYTGKTEDIQTIKHTMLHEIYHGMLYEMGYTYFGDEEFVERLTHLTFIGEDILSQMLTMFEKK